MRASCLALILALSSGAATAAEPNSDAFLARLEAMGPQELSVAEGLGPVIPGVRARVAVKGRELVITWREVEGGPERLFRYDADPLAPPDPGSWEDPDPEVDLFADLCQGGGNSERLIIKCWTRSALQSRARRPPAVIYDLRLSSDGLRVVRAGFGPRLVFTPPGAAPRVDPRLTPGVPANLADALAQLDASDRRLGGGTSGSGDWYGSDLIVSRVRGLDFALERTVTPDRGGRSNLVPAVWLFDYQGPPPDDPQAMAWLMVRRRAEARETEFWCVGRHEGGTVTIGCHQGRKPSEGRGKLDIQFRIQPFPRWTIHVDPGADNPFTTVGTGSIEMTPHP